MYSKIYNPQTKNYININSKNGINWLNKYLINLNGGSGARLQQVEREAADAHRQNDERQQAFQNSDKYIIVTVGPTGSGKGDLIEKVEEYLKIPKIPKENFILVDNLIENDPYYRIRVNNILKRKENCGSNGASIKTPCDARDFVSNPDKTLLTLFEDAYYTTRFDIGCGKFNTEGTRRANCNDVNDSKFTAALERGENFVFETTGEGNMTWFLTRSYWWKDEFDNLKKNNYKVIYAFSLVKFADLIERNKTRAISSINKYIEGDFTGAVPRLPDVQAEAFNEKATIIGSNLIQLANKCLFKPEKDAGFCGEYPINNILIYDNNKGKGNMELIYNHEELKYDFNALKDLVFDTDKYTLPSERVP